MKTAVIGAGTMGNGIAHVFAAAGNEVLLVDTSETALQRALEIIRKNLGRQVEKGLLTEVEKEAALSRIHTEASQEPSYDDCDLIIEAATENPHIKLEIFRKLGERCRPETILATNTSSISITKIAAVVNDPGRVIGMHFMNPVPVMKLVEVISGYATRPEVVAKVMDTARKLGKTPVEVNDYPGFVANRILMPMINEAIFSLYEGVAGVEEIDTVMKLGMAHPMGPLQLADLIGLDVCLYILQVMHEGFGQPKYAPCPLLVNMVQAGQTGIKAGAGFYTYGSGTKELVVAPRFKKG